MTASGLKLVRLPWKGGRVVREERWGRGVGRREVHRGAGGQVQGLEGGEEAEGVAPSPQHLQAPQVAEVGGQAGGLVGGHGELHQANSSNTTLYQPRGDCLKNAGPPCRMIFWVILSLILAGYCFLRAGTDRPKCLKIYILCGFPCDFAMYTF